MGTAASNLSANFSAKVAYANKLASLQADTKLWNENLLYNYQVGFNNLMLNLRAHPPATVPPAPVPPNSWQIINQVDPAKDQSEMTESDWIAALDVLSADQNGAPVCPTPVINLPVPVASAWFSRL